MNNLSSRVWRSVGVTIMLLTGFFTLSADDDIPENEDNKTVYLQEVIVKPKREKYSKKNNPAVDFVSQLRQESGLYDPTRLPLYSYDKYEKTLFALNEFKSDLKKDFSSKKISFLKNYVDTSIVTGKRLLDLMIKEKMSTRLHGTDPRVNKEITRGYRSEGIDEVLDQENVRIVLEDAIREMDIYGNDITILQNRFVSPLSKIGPDFYKYYLLDTVNIGDTRCVELGFVPRNVESLGFVGNIYVPVGDSTMFVKKLTMRTASDINLNYLEAITVNQSFEKDSLGMRHKIYDDVCIELRIAPGTPRLYGRKTTVYDNFSYELRKDLEDFYRMQGRDFSETDATIRSDNYWTQMRKLPLTKAESRIGNLMVEMRNVPLLYWGEKAIGILENGYVATWNPSKFDFGPLTSAVSSNKVEGLRLRAGGMTTPTLNRHLFADGYIAYGFHDRRWKYEGYLEYSFNPKKKYFSEWPRNSVYASYSYDLDMIGQHYLFDNQDNIFLSLRRKGDMPVTYRRRAEVGYIVELPHDFSIDFRVRTEKQESTRWTPFIFADGRSETSFRESSFGLTLRWAPGEKFVLGRTIRWSVNMDSWIFQFTQEYGPKGFLGSAFTMNKSELSVQKRLWFSAFGYLDVIVKGGIIWDKVYYPALLWPNANLSYTIQRESYSLLNPMEFALDRYGAVDVSYFGNGILFNRIPKINKLKLREVVTFKGLAGALSHKNDPKRNQDLYRFPEQYRISEIGKIPYMELGIGLDNILSLFRVDYVWRLTHRKLPGFDRGGLRVSLHFSF